MLRNKTSVAQIFEVGDFRDAHDHVSTQSWIIHVAFRNISNFNKLEFQRWSEVKAQCERHQTEPTYLRERVKSTYRWNVIKVVSIVSFRVSVPAQDKF
jgi:hypothetical protein